MVKAGHSPADVNTTGSYISSNTSVLPLSFLVIPGHRAPAGRLALCHRPACTSAGSSIPAAVRSWAMPTRPLWPVKPSPRPVDRAEAHSCRPTCQADNLSTNPGVTSSDFRAAEKGNIVNLLAVVIEIVRPFPLNQLASGHIQWVGLSRGEGSPG